MSGQFQFDLLNVNEIRDKSDEQRNYESRLTE